MKKRPNPGTTVLLIIIILSVLLSACGDAAKDPGPAEILIPGKDEAAQSASPFVSDRDITVEITEVMYSNRSTLRDSYGSYSDWIEFENTGSTACSLEGFWLSDDSNDLMKWRFPAISIAPGERLVVFCSGKESIDDELHTGFSLSRDGDPLYFSYPSGSVKTAVIPTGKLDHDISLCIDGDTCYTTYASTPGFPNTEAGRVAFLESSDIHGDLVINEACPYNDSYNLALGKYYDWIELKNVSDHALDLSNYYLTDDPDDPFKYQLPHTMLSPGKFFVVTCSGDKDLSGYSFCSFGFSLGAGGDCVFLYDSSGNMSDSTGIYDVPLRGSIGRMDNEKGLFIFEKATPGKANLNGYRFRTDAPVSSVSEGVYNDVTEISVELTADGTVYYTTDGSFPTENSFVYTGPIVLKKTSVLRAVAKQDGKMISKCATFSFIINEGHSLPVVSVACNQRQFKKVYSAAYGRDVFCDATVSYFGDDGSFNADCSLKLHGASARTVFDRKHFKLVFNDRYGGDLQYNLFGSENFSGLHSFTLRGGPVETLHVIKDSLTAIVANNVSPVDPYALDSINCVLYINGDYWGIYAIREAYSGKYVEEHAGIDEKSAIIIRTPEYGDTSMDFYDLYRYIVSKDMRNDEYYSYVKERLDLKSLAVWMCFESYFNNNDPIGNVRYFRDNDSANSKWKIMFFDLDISLGNNSATWYRITEPGSQIGNMCNSLVKSEEYQQLLLETASEIVNNGLSDEYCLEVFSELVDKIDSEAPRSLAKWKESLAYYNVFKEHIRSVFSNGRMQSWLDGLQKMIKASDETMSEYFPDYY